MSESNGAKLGVLVGENKWTFFKEIYEDLAKSYSTQVFKSTNRSGPFTSGRISRWRFRNGIRTMLRHNDICFFEWSSDLLMPASHMPKTCPIVTRLHSFELYEWAPKINWDAVDKVILVSKAMEKRFSELYPKHASKTSVIYNGRSPETFRPSQNRDFDFTLGMLGTVLPIKRVYETVLMLYTLRTQGYPAQLRIAGATDREPRYFASIRRLVDELQLQDSVRFDGHVLDTPSWLQQIDILISNSYWEGQQVALIEAMSSGCYCLSHRWDGAEEMLPKENLFTSENELIDKIVRYADASEADRHESRMRLRSIACMNFGIEQTKANVRRTINELL